MRYIEIHVGFDDVDSPSGGCTTHYASLLLAKWVKRGLELIDYPNLTRLNPGVPWKTRGNGSVVIRARVESEDRAKDLFEEALSFIYEYLGAYSEDWKKYSQPAVAMYVGEVEDRIKWFGSKALYDIVPISLLELLLDKVRGRLYYSIPGSGKRGLIGAIAGIGNRMLRGDYTYELVAYRSPDYIGSERKVSKESIIAMDKLYGRDTILNYDYETDRPLIMPHGPDPVLLGIRGEEPDILLKAFSKLDIYEPVPLAVVYRTNQHTDQHLKPINNLKEAYPYRSIKIYAQVSTKPRRILGGHVLFKITDGSDEIDVAAYQPTGGFRDIVEMLEPGDLVEVMGVIRPPSSRHGRTLNLEKIHVVMAKPKIVLENPKCPKCGARMKSMGRNKGFKCPKCGFKSKSATKIKRVVKRSLEPGWYEPPPRAFKHLMKPIKRFGREKEGFPKIYRPGTVVLVEGRSLSIRS